MADYRLPMDADGVKYHGTVDQNEENPGQFMYGLDENGNKRIIRTDEQGNVLTRVTGSIVENEIIGERKIRNRTETLYKSSVPEKAIGLIAYLTVYSSTGKFVNNEGISLLVASRSQHEPHNILYVQTEHKTDNRPHMIYWTPSANKRDAQVWLPKTRDVKITGLPLSRMMKFEINIKGEFEADEGFDCMVSVEWIMGV